MITGKRKFRELSDETKEKISTSTMGRPKTAQHRANISKGMQEYWRLSPTDLNLQPERPPLPKAMEVWNKSETSLSGCQDAG